MADTESPAAGAQPTAAEPIVEATPKPPAEPAPVDAAENAAEPAAEPTAEPAAEKIAAESTVEPAAEPATVNAEPAAEPAAENAAEKTDSAVEPAAENAAEPAAEPAAESATVNAEPAAEPAAENAAEPATENAAELAAENAVENTVEPAAEPAVDPAPEPAAEPAVEPKAEDVSEAKEREQSPSRVDGLSREEFIRQMGLTAEDITDPSRTGQLTDPSVAEIAAYREPGEGPQLIEDDVWLRNADLTDPSIIRQSLEAERCPNQYRVAMLESFRTTHSGSSPSRTHDGSGEDDRDHPHHTTKDHQLFVDYKSQLLSKYRERKQTGTVHTPPRPSPRRQHGTSNSVQH